MMNYDEIISLLTKEPTYYFIFYLGVAFAIFTFVASQFIIAPYGRFASKTYGNQNFVNSQYKVMNRN